MTENYNQKLKDPRWQKKRLKILERDNFTCQYCQCIDETLHVHHFEYKGNPWDIDNKKLITVCERCHFIIEEAKRNNAEVIDIDRDEEDGLMSAYVLIESNIPSVAVFKIQPSKTEFIVLIHKSALKHHLSKIDWYLDTDNYPKHIKNNIKNQ